MARHEDVVDRAGSFAAGTSVKTDFNYVTEIYGGTLRTNSPVVELWSGSAMVDSGKGLAWDTIIASQSMSGVSDWSWASTSKYILNSGDEIAVGMAGSAPIIAYYMIKGEYIR